MPSPPQPARPSLGDSFRLVSIWISLARFRWVLVVILLLAWFLRARNPHFASAYMDESIFILYGRMFLSHHFESPIDQPLNFTFGWYLWPILASWANRLYGLVGVRELGALLGTITVASVYGFARRIFSPAVGLASALIFALLAPAIFISRIATRDAGSICFFALGLWLFARSWQVGKWPSWLLSSLSFFAAFLSKYLVALFFPFFVILTLRKGRQGILAFSLPLTILCAFYGFHYRAELAALLQYGSSYGSLKAPAAAAWQIYVTHRLDFWVLVLLSPCAWLPAKGASRWTAALLLCGAAVIPIFQMISRADYDYWKHVNYSFLFLVPLAMEGLFLLVRRAAPSSNALASAALVAALAVGFGWAGNSWHIDQFVFWPNAEPIAAYFQGKLTPRDRVLVDDTVLRYYLSPPLDQGDIVDPFYFRYGSQTGAAAYAAATRDGRFDYIALDGGIGADAKKLRAAIEPALAAHYSLEVRMPDSALGQPIRIYARRDPPPARRQWPAPKIEITSPASGALVETRDKAATLSAIVKGISPGDYSLVDVFTNRWYRQSGKIYSGVPDGAFRSTVLLAGRGREQCHHIVRVRVFDAQGHLLASAMNFNVVRAAASGSRPACK